MQVLDLISPDPPALSRGEDEAESKRWVRALQVCVVWGGGGVCMCVLVGGWVRGDSVGREWGCGRCRCTFVWGGNCVGRGGAWEGKEWGWSCSCAMCTAVSCHGSAVCQALS